MADAPCTKISTNKSPRCSNAGKRNGSEYRRTPGMPSTKPPTGLAKHRDRLCFSARRSENARKALRPQWLFLVAAPRRESALKLGGCGLCPTVGGRSVWVQPQRGVQFFPQPIYGDPQVLQHGFQISGCFY